MTLSAAPPGVLVVEDDYLIANDIASALERAGAVVVGPASNIRASLASLEQPHTLDAAVLDIRLGKDLVFPLADALVGEAVPLIFFSGYDDVIIPERFAGAMRVSKSRGVDELVSAVLEQRYRNASTPDLVGNCAFDIAELLPELRWRARQFVADHDAADDLVEETLQVALASLESGRWRGTSRENLNRLLTETHRRRRMIN